MSRIVNDGSGANDLKTEWLQNKVGDSLTEGGPTINIYVAWLTFGSCLLINPAAAGWAPTWYKLWVVAGFGYHALS